METGGSRALGSIHSHLCIAVFVCCGQLSAFVVDKVIYWKDLQDRMVAYNQIMESVELMELPRVGQNVVHWSDLLGKSEGQLHYARHDKRHLEVPSPPCNPNVELHFLDLY
ncbi:hypothetical protein RHMOL_Rhmol13G0252900 [Rhododendron molle]|uniref:Uncharacterized protein n=1 Tax=Rhododendron molle TaxID=49168 RepID=A0ACC0LC73_RHOML|nr:hypothetical protein RHMOL_Rhmol13G0252900 [Rhododendron molle]